MCNNFFWIEKNIIAFKVTDWPSPWPCPPSPGPGQRQCPAQMIVTQRIVMPSIVQWCMASYCSANFVLILDWSIQEDANWRWILNKWKILSKTPLILFFNKSFLKPLLWHHPHPPISPRACSPFAPAPPSHSLGPLRAPRRRRSRCRVAVLLLGLASPHHCPAPCHISI